MNLDRLADEISKKKKKFYPNLITKSAIKFTAKRACFEEKVNGVAGKPLFSALEGSEGQSCSHTQGSLKRLYM